MAMKLLRVAPYSVPLTHTCHMYVYILVACWKHEIKRYSSEMSSDIKCFAWKAFLRGRRLVKVIIDQAHLTIDHFGQFNTSHYM